MQNLSSKRGTRARTAGVSRNSEADGEPGVSVFTTQRLIPPARQRSGIPDFLNNLAQFADDRRRTKADNVAAEVDATGRELTEEEQGNKLLVNTVAAKRGKRVSVERLADLEANVDRRIQQAIEDGDEAALDPDTLIQEEFGDLLDAGPNSDNQFYVEQVQAAMSSAKDFAAKRTAQVESRVADAQMLEDFTGTVSAAMRSDQEITADKMRFWAREENEEDLAFSMTTNEISEGMANGALNAINRAPTKERAQEIHKAVTTFLGEHDKRFLERNADDIQDALTNAENRIESDELEANALSERDKALTLAKANSMMQFDPTSDDTLQFIMDNFQEGQENFTPAQFVSLMKQRSKAFVDLRDESDKKATTAAKHRAFLENPELLEGATTAERTGFFEAQEEEYEAESRAFFSQITAAVNMDDPQEQSNQLTAMAGPNGALAELQPLLNLAHQTGYTPKILRSALTVHNVNSPRLAAAAKAQELIRLRTGPGSAVFSELDTKSSALLSAYTLFTRDGGLTDEQAKARIQERSVVELKEIQKDFQREEGTTEFLDDALESFGDIRNKTNLRTKLRDLALEEYRLTGNAEESIEWARERVAETSANMGGTLVPARGIHAVMRNNYNTRPMQDMMKIAAQAKGFEGDMQDLQIMPMPSTGTTGFVRVLDKTTGDFLMDEGSPVTINTMKISRLFLKSIQFQAEQAVEDLDLNNVRQEAIEQRLLEQRSSVIDRERADRQRNPLG